MSLNQYFEDLLCLSILYITDACCVTSGVAGEYQAYIGSQQDWQTDHRVKDGTSWSLYTSTTDSRTRNNNVKYTPFVVHWCSG